MKVVSPFFCVKKNINLQINFKKTKALNKKIIKLIKINGIKMAVSLNHSLTFNCSSEIMSYHSSTKAIETYRKKFKDLWSSFNGIESSFSQKNGSFVRVPLLTKADRRALRGWSSVYSYAGPSEEFFRKYFPNEPCSDFAFSGLMDMARKFAQLTNSLWKSFFNSELSEMCRKDSIESESWVLENRWSNISNILNYETIRIKSMEVFKSKQELCTFMTKHSIGKELGNPLSVQFELLVRLWMLIAENEEISKSNPFNEICSRKWVFIQNPSIEFFSDAEDAIIQMHELLSLTRKLFKDCQDNGKNSSISEELLQIKQIGKEKKIPKWFVWSLCGIVPSVTTILCAFGLKSYFYRKKKGNTLVANQSQGGEHIELVEKMKPDGHQIQEEKIGIDFSTIEFELLPEDLKKEGYLL